MEKTIIIEYHPERCIGAQKCVAAAPQYFRFENQKAVLLNSTIQNQVNLLQVQINEDQFAPIQEAAERCPVNAIKVSDEKGTILVSDTVEVHTEGLREIRAEYDDGQEFVMDEKGYFLIRVNPAAQEIEVAFCPELNTITVKVRGKKPLEIYQTIIKEKLISRMDHAAYLGRELQKAYLALQRNIPYIQDDELNI